MNSKAKFKLDHRWKWYSLEIFRGGKWVDAGEVYHNDHKWMTRREMVQVNFLGEEVRMVEHVHASRPIGDTKQF